MLKLAFSAVDVAQTRLAYSALNEAVMSLRVLKDPSYHALYLPWVREVRPWLRRTGPDLRLLSDLVPVAGRTPDFVTPPPSTPVPDLGDELASLRALDADQVRAEIDRMAGPLPESVRALRADPVAGLARLAESIEAYWATAIAPYWPRVRGLLEGDILHRARRIAEGGAELLFRDLHPQVTWRDGVLHVAHRPYSHSRTARGRGLLLVPSAFVWPKVFTITPPPWQPTLIYAPRGVATLWEQGRATASEALTRVLGRSRALLLAELDAPATTTELAHRTGMTTGGTSQHLTALRDAGLVIPSREGRYVLYARTAVADALLASAGRCGERPSPGTSGG